MVAERERRAAAAHPVSRKEEACGSDTFSPWAGEFPLKKVQKEKVKVAGCVQSD